jgi:hypothetical protein
VTVDDPPELVLDLPRESTVTVDNLSEPELDLQQETTVEFHDDEEEFPFTQWEDDMFLNQSLYFRENQITHENL